MAWDCGTKCEPPQCKSFNSQDLVWVKRKGTSGNCKAAARDNTSHVKISVPHNKHTTMKSTAFRYTNRSMWSGHSLFQQSQASQFPVHRVCIKLTAASRGFLYMNEWQYCFQYFYAETSHNVELVLKSRNHGHCSSETVQQANLYFIYCMLVCWHNRVLWLKMS